MSGVSDFERAKHLIELKRELKVGIASLRESHRGQVDSMWEMGKILERVRGDFFRERDGGDGTEQEDEAWQETLEKHGVTQEEYDDVTLFTAHHPNQPPSKTMTPGQLDNLMEILNLRPLLRAKGANKPPERENGEDG